MTEKALQKLIFQRFQMAATTYVLVLVLAWIAFAGGFLVVPMSGALVGSALVLASQAGLWLVFAKGWNQRCRDPSLTELQILLALSWQTWLMANLVQARGTFMVLYVLLLLFGLFHLGRRVFTRCALLVFMSFCGLNLIEGYQDRLADPWLAAVQTSVLFVVLLWLCLFASYVQASRQRMRQRRFALQAHQDTLRGMMRQLEDLVATDELTGLFNRRHFLRLASRELVGMNPQQRHGLALIDLDHFKQINDQFGHAAGDRVLQCFARIASECVREGDVLARYGGEEFVLLLLNSTPERLAACCERVRVAFSQARPDQVDIRSLSLSVGMTLINEDDDLDEALHRADEALYRAKRSGRNRCEAAWNTVDA